VIDLRMYKENDPLAVVTLWGHEGTVTGLYWKHNRLVTGGRARDICAWRNNALWGNNAMRYRIQNDDVVTALSFNEKVLLVGGDTRVTAYRFEGEDVDEKYAKNFESMRLKKRRK